MYYVQVSLQTLQSVPFVFLSICPHSICSHCLNFKVSNFPLQACSFFLFDLLNFHLNFIINFFIGFIVNFNNKICCDFIQSYIESKEQIIENQLFNLQLSVWNISDLNGLFKFLSVMLNSLEYMAFIFTLFDKFSSYLILMNSNYE